jgi:hypothetical protein
MILASHLQTLLQHNGGRIIDNLSEQDMSEYQYIKEHLSDGDIREDEDLIERISQFYQFKKHRINKKSKAHFFEVLEAKKAEDPLVLDQTVDMFLGPENRNDYKEKHFMLLSQLLHLLDDQYGIYDKALGVLLNFALPSGQLIGNYQKKTAFLEFYANMAKMKNSFLESEPVSDLMKVVRIKHGDFKEILTENKRMDLIFRSAADLHHKGELLRARNQVVA